MIDDGFFANVLTLPFKLASCVAAVTGDDGFVSFLPTHEIPLLAYEIVWSLSAMPSFRVFLICVQ